MKTLDSTKSFKNNHALILSEQGISNPDNFLLGNPGVADVVSYIQITNKYVYICLFELITSILDKSDLRIIRAVSLCYSVIPKHSELCAYLKKEMHLSHADTPKAIVNGFINFLLFACLSQENIKHYGQIANDSSGLSRELRSGKTQLSLARKAFVLEAMG